MESLQWTLINHPWRRNSHNAELFDAVAPEGSHLTQHWSERSGDVVGECTDGGSDGSDGPIDVEGLGEEDRVAHMVKNSEESEVDVKMDEDEESSIDYNQLYAESEHILADDPKLLKDERLLKVAYLFTNGEIIEKVKLHHPHLALPTRIVNITQTLSESITRVAAQRGVAREVVKQELHSMRDANGVIERQTAYNTAKQMEARKAKKAAERSDRAEADWWDSVVSAQVRGVGERSKYFQ